MNAATRQRVIERAERRCEYCRFPQAAMPLYTFHVEHIIAQQHVTDDSDENLAYACPNCNRFKGPNITTIDLTTRRIVSLFHPRHDQWEDHFEFRGAMIQGLTGTGVATVRLLQMNAEERVELRQALMDAGDM